MTLSEMFKESVKLWLVQKGLEVTEVTGWDESTRDSGGCETCAYTCTEVEVYYTTPSARYPQTYTYDGNFSELLQELIVL